ncbi:MAG TPA: type I DNA topoisomerase [Levilinea sp.]|nr:type I DNA topoisomerase [Levilinea sp.]
MEAYCVKCKTKREIQTPKADFNAAGAPVTHGTCPVCSTRMFRTGRTPEHEGMQAPARPSPEIQRNGRLVIVESPAKAKTVSRYLGKGYQVRASIGHVRDLLRSQLSVDVENGFEPKYRVPNDKRQVVKEIKSLAQKAKEVYLATDPDREGEAIAWHLMEAAGIDPRLTRRVEFHEITEGAILDAFSHPREINMNLVDAQQARRVLDRLVGYSLSPLLWEKVRSRLSAGRVQSVALRLLVEREREIDAFVAREYWTIEAELKPDGLTTTFIARLNRVDDQEPELPNETTARVIADDMEQATYVIQKIKRGERKRKPAAPYVTSTMQQEASRRLGFTAKRTMALAQQLYEGLDVGNGGTTGLITYMRTDSTNISAQAQAEARAYIQETYGKDYTPDTPPQYRVKVKGAQEAHEAIRPTAVYRHPDQVKKHLNRDQQRLYQLIWQRFVASQMEAAIYDTLVVDIRGTSPAHSYLLRSSGSSIRFPGFLVVYEETQDEDKRAEDADDVRIPAGIEEGQSQELVRVIPEQHFTQPPPRYTEASLVAALEAHGIGRPSTYAPILSTIQDRGYAIREAKRLIPTETGILVNDLLVDHFPEIVDTKFTAVMEEDLDAVAEGESHWTDVVSEFYREFAPQVERAQKEMPAAKSGLEKIGRDCPQCGSELVIRYGRFGKFISCSGFPDCRYTEPWLEKIGVKCPDCANGEIVNRKTRKGRIFYGCSNYPECQFTSWKRPLATPCPSCGGTLIVSNKKEVQCLRCGETFLAESTGDIVIESA